MQVKYRPSSVSMASVFRSSHAHTGLICIPKHKLAAFVLPFADTCRAARNVSPLTHSCKCPFALYFMPGVCIFVLLAGDFTVRGDPVRCGGCSPVFLRATSPERALQRKCERSVRLVQEVPVRPLGREFHVSGATIYVKDGVFTQTHTADEATPP